MANKGLKLELEFSQTFHAEGVPILISPTLLRQRDMGQVDLARLRRVRDEWVVELGEVKSSLIGTEQMLKSQRGRLFATAHFLSGVFSARSRLINLIA